MSQQLKPKFVAGVVDVDPNLTKGHNKKERLRREINIKCRDLTILDFMPIMISQRDHLGRFIKGDNGQFGKKRTEQYKINQSKTMTKLWESAEFRSKLFTETHRNNLSKAKIGLKLTESERDVISIATKLAMQDPEIREKCRVSKLGKKLKPESIIKREKTRRINGWYTPEGLEIIKESARNTISKQIFPLEDTKPERIMQIALRLNQIDYKAHFCIFDGKGFFHRVDLFIKPNIVVEIDGDYWHANPQKYQSDFKLKGGMTAKERWVYDLQINNHIQTLGYKMIRLWESDIIKDPQKSTESIIRIRENSVDTRR